MMKILLPVFFHSAMGGLHLHILSSVKHVLREGHDVTVVCKPGPFAEEVRTLGGQVIETDYSTDDVKRVIEQVRVQSYDVVYAHPFDSRQLGLAVAEANQIPFVLVIHGMYHDDIQQYHQSVSRIIAVSEQIAAYLVEICPEVEEKVQVITNGVSDSFVPTDESQPSERLVGLFTSRLDADKLFILDVFLDALKDERVKSLPIDWIVIGDGTQREKYEARYEEALAGTGQRMEWLGWLNQEELPQAMRRADFIIAPGRSALEAMAVGKPTIAVGSKGYQGLVTPETWQSIAGTNFGGIGTKYDGYTSGQIGDEILRLVDESFRREIASFSVKLVDEHFRDEQSQRQLVELFQAVMSEGGPVVDVHDMYPFHRYEQLHYFRSSHLLEGKLETKEKQRVKIRDERDEARRNTNQVKRDLIAANRTVREQEKTIKALEKELETLRQSAQETLQQRDEFQLSAEELKSQIERVKKHPIGKFFA